MTIVAPNRLQYIHWQPALGAGSDYLPENSQAVLPLKNGTIGRFLLRRSTL